MDLPGNDSLREERGGRRGARNALANAGVPMREMPEKVSATAGSFAHASASVSSDTIPSATTTE